MDFNNNQPIYIQIMNFIKVQIIKGELREGEKLYSVRDLSTKMKVNPNTIQRSYQELEREGLVMTQRGMGTFVSEDIEVIKNLKNSMATNIINGFLSDMKELGFTSNDILNLIKDRVGEV